MFHFIIHYSLFGSLHNATYETYKVLGGFALGLPHTATYFGQLFFSCGPMWYLLSLMIAWILLDLILNIFPEQYINWAVLGTMLLGWGILHHLGGSFLHRPGHGHCSGSVCGLPCQEV